MQKIKTKCLKKKVGIVLLIFVRTIILYILVLVVMRFMGKREIGQLQPFELAISIMIADLATIPMSSPRNAYIKWNNSDTRTFSNAFTYFFIKFEKYVYEKDYMWKTFFSYI